MSWRKILKALLRGIAAVWLFLLTFVLLLYASWAVVSGIAERHFRPEHGARVISVAFSPDGQTLASASVDRTLKVWRPADGTLLWTTRASYPPWMREGFIYAESLPFLVLLVLSVLFSVLMVIGIFRFGRQLLSRRKGALAVASNS